MRPFVWLRSCYFILTSRFGAKTHQCVMPGGKHSNAMTDIQHSL